MMMEAMRILKTLDVKMPRTVRLGLWTAEEQGLLGSRAYVKEHFADPADMKTKPEHGKLSAYFNVDKPFPKRRGLVNLRCYLTSCFAEEFRDFIPKSISRLLVFQDLGRGCG